MLLHPYMSHPLPDLPNLSNLFPKCPTPATPLNTHQAPVIHSQPPSKGSCVTVHDNGPTCVHLCVEQGDPTASVADEGVVAFQSDGEPSVRQEKGVSCTSH